MENVTSEVAGSLALPGLTGHGQPLYSCIPLPLGSTVFKSLGLGAAHPCVLRCAQCRFCQLHEKTMASGHGLGTGTVSLKMQQRQNQESEVGGLEWGDPEPLSLSQHR